MTWSPIGVYHPGASPLHRMRPGAKLLSLIVLAVALMLLHNAWATGAALALMLALIVVARLPFVDFMRTIRGFAIIAVLLFAFNTWQRGVEEAFTVVGSLIALIIASTIVTQTTRSDDMVATITWALTPLTPLGVNPERIALAFSLTLRAIPTLFEIAHETRAAARARGLERNLRAYATPLVIRSVLHARLLGEALEARGIDEPEPRAKP